MSDQEFIKQFEDCTLPKAELNHRNHLRIAWCYLSQLPREQAQTKIIAGIIRYAASIGASSIYNQTLTLLWVHWVHQALRAQSQPSPTFEDFIQKNSYLGDKTLPQQYYSEDRLKSEQARQGWIDPDLKPLS